MTGHRHRGRRAPLPVSAEPDEVGRLSQRELIQRLAATEDLMRRLPHARSDDLAEASRRALLAQQSTLVRELRQRRLAVRRPSAAWPPPPW